MASQNIQASSPKCFFSSGQICIGMISSSCQTKECVWVGQGNICSTNTIFLFLCLIVNLYNFINKFGRQVLYMSIIYNFSSSLSCSEINHCHQSQQPCRSCKNHSNYGDYLLHIQCVCLNCNDINVPNNQKQINHQKTKQSQVFFTFVSTFAHLDPQSIHNKQQAEQDQLRSYGGGAIVEYVVFIDELKILKNECKIREDLIIIEHDLEVDRKQGLRISFFLVGWEENHSKCNYKFKFEYHPLQMNNFSLQSL